MWKKLDLTPVVLGLWPMVVVILLKIMCWLVGANADDGILLLGFVGYFATVAIGVALYLDPNLARRRVGSWEDLTEEKDVSKTR